MKNTKEKVTLEILEKQSKDKVFSSFNIMGEKVLILKNTLKIPKKMAKEIETDREWFCAYVELQDSNVLSDYYLGNVTYREDDVLGVDTAHAFNEGQPLENKLSSALHQIERVIKKWKIATQDYYGDDDE